MRCFWSKADARKPEKCASQHSTFELDNPLWRSEVRPIIDWQSSVSKHPTWFPADNLLTGFQKRCLKRVAALVQLGRFGLNGLERIASNLLTVNDQIQACKQACESSQKMVDLELLISIMNCIVMESENWTVSLKQPTGETLQKPTKLRLSSGAR